MDSFTLERHNSFLYIYIKKKKNSFQTSSFTLKRHNSFQNSKTRKATHNFAPRPLILKLQQEPF